MCDVVCKKCLLLILKRVSNSNTSPRRGLGFFTIALDIDPGRKWGRDIHPKARVGEGITIRGSIEKI